jgi:hypothetical protein
MKLLSFSTLMKRSTNESMVLSLMVVHVCYAVHLQTYNLIHSSKRPQQIEVNR